MKRLLIRFDDLNPYMSLKIIKEIKKTCQKYKNSVLLCIIPFCEDKDLMKNEGLEEHFWQAMRYCQNQNSVIGLHGLNHKLFVNNTRQIFNLSNKTEFSGVSLKNQIKMIKREKNF